MIRWIESNGYDVSYIAGVDTDRSARAPQSTRSSCRSATTSTGRDASAPTSKPPGTPGVHLAFFSGNEVFWKTRWEPSIDGVATAHRTLVSYKETHANAEIRPDRDVDRHVARPRFSPPTTAAGPRTR